MVEAQKAQRITFGGAKGFLVTENNKNQRKTNRTSSQKVVQCRKNLKTQIFLLLSLPGIWYWMHFTLSS